MKRLLVVAVSMFAFTSALADDTRTVETKKVVKSGKGKSTVTTEVKAVNDPDGLGNSTTDKVTAEKEVKSTATGGKETTTETTRTHDAPGMKNDGKTTTKTKVVRDANGNIVKEDLEKK